MIKTQKIEWLQILRGIGALMVLLFHMTPHWELSPISTPFTHISKWLFSGVDIFFVLSGFVIFNSLDKNVENRNLWGFLKERFARIYLSYWVVLFFYTLFYIFYIHKYPESTHMIFGSIFLIFPYYWNNWLPVAWSLTYELYFYIIAILIFWIFKKFAFIASIFIFIIILSYNLFWLFQYPNEMYVGEQSFRFLMTGYFIEFSAGMLVAGVWKRNNFMGNKIAIKLIAIGAVFLIGLGFYLGIKVPYSSNVEIVRSLTFGLMGLGGLIFALSLHLLEVKPIKWLVKTGDASFSFYLLHVPLLDALGIFRFNYLDPIKFPALVFNIFSIVFILIISYAWFYFIERKLIKFGKRKFSSKATMHG